MAKRRWTREEVDAYRKEHGAVGYFNKEDANLFVPKMYSFGFTLNWANPIAWVIGLAIIGLIVWKIITG